MEFDKLGAELDTNYIPKCIQQLNNTENLLIKLVECLDGRNPSEYCKYVPEQHRTTESTSFDVITSSTSSPPPPLTTTESDEARSSTTTTKTTTITTRSTTTTTMSDFYSSATEMMRSSTTTTTAEREESGGNQSDLDRISTMLLIVLIEFPILALINLVAVGLVIYILLKKKTPNVKVRPSVDTNNRNVNLDAGNANYAFSSTYL